MLDGAGTGIVAVGEGEAGGGVTVAVADGEAEGDATGFVGLLGAADGVVPGVVIPLLEEELVVELGVEGMGEK